MRRILLALALVAMVATSASATTTVWWTMDSSNCQATASIVNSQLIIEKPLHAPAGFYEFTLTMHMSNDSAAATQGLTSYRTNIWRGPDTLMTWAAPLTPTQYGDESTVGLLNPLAWGGTKGGNVNTGDYIAQAYGRGRSGSQTPLNTSNSPADFIRFTLRIDQADEQYSATHNIYQTVGAGFFAHLPAQEVVFGSNPAVAGGTVVSSWATASATLPVIVIHAIPEPATLVLFGLGLVGLLRRR